MSFQPVRMDASLVPKHFGHDTTLYRRRADGSFKKLTTVNSGRLVATFDNERIDAAAIVWCLYHGSWPKYHLAVVDGNPHNLDLDNIYPIVGKPLRYRQGGEPGLYTHPLSEMAFRTPDECRLSWNLCARDHYKKTLGLALAQEKQERQLREASAAPNPHLLDYEKRMAERTERLAKRLVDLRPKADTKSVAGRPERPSHVPRHMWHWHEDRWISIMEPVHVSDDYRRRIAAVQRGAVRAEYQPDFEEVWYFDAAGAVIKL